MIPRTVLVVAEPFASELDARRAAGVVGRGIQAVDAELELDLCPLERADDRDTLAHHLASVDFDARMRAARAVVLCASRLDESTLTDSAMFEIATRARQAGVPAYAVARSNALNLFDARILDLQIVLDARDARALRRAGRRLAGLL